jgi:hypothetical protein
MRSPLVILMRGVLRKPCRHLAYSRRVTPWGGVGPNSAVERFSRLSFSDRLRRELCTRNPGDLRGVQRASRGNKGNELQRRVET